MTPQQPTLHSMTNEAASGAPRFSIITATFNCSDLFDRTAASLRSQTFKDFEWIVIDGLSRDDTVEHIKTNEDIVTYWISEKDSGISDAWNKGLVQAKGEYVLMLNAGDTYDPEFLGQVNLHARDDSRVVCSHARLCTSDGRVVGVIRSEPHKLYRAMHLAHNWCAVPRKHYIALGGFRIMRFAMDFEWFHKYFRLYGADGFTVIDAALGTYHLGGVSDANFAASFRTNSEILRAHGTSWVVAGFWRFAYTFKHALRTMRVKEKVL